MPTDSRDQDTVPTPSGAVGTDADRDRSGRFTAGNKAALIVGDRSAAFWNDVDALKRDIARQLVSDAGFTDDDAPEALRRVADGLAQAVLVRDSAFQRLVESGGPLTSSGRARRAFAVWVAACDRVERHAKVLGLQRRSRSTLSIAERIAEYGRRQAEGDDRT
jgi:hypothetical protein